MASWLGLSYLSMLHQGLKPLTNFTMVSFAY